MLMLKNFPPMQVQFEFQISNWLLVYPMQAQIITHSTWFMRFSKDINVFRKKKGNTHMIPKQFFFFYSQTIKLSQLLKKSIASSNSSVLISTTSLSLSFKPSDWLTIPPATFTNFLIDFRWEQEAQQRFRRRRWFFQEKIQNGERFALSLNRCCCFDCLVLIFELCVVAASEEEGAEDYLQAWTDT